MGLALTLHLMGRISAPINYVNQSPKKVTVRVKPGRL
nr:MAG TPA: hypothetical protein [Caudoviricetes sp.]